LLCEVQGSHQRTQEMLARMTEYQAKIDINGMTAMDSARTFKTAIDVLGELIESMRHQTRANMVEGVIVTQTGKSGSVEASEN
jgi:hypothetical protein